MLEAVTDQQTFSPEAQRVAREFLANGFEKHASLSEDFPGVTVEQFRDGLVILRGQYADARTEFETRHDLIFPEFRYAARIFSLDSRPDVEQLRARLIPEIARCKSIGAIAPDLSDPVVTELVCIDHWMCDGHSEPQNLSYSEQTKMEGAAYRFANYGASLANNQELVDEMHAVETLAERYLLLALRISALEAR